MGFEDSAEVQEEVFDFGFPGDDEVMNEFVLPHDGEKAGKIVGVVGWYRITGTVWKSFGTAEELDRVTVSNVRDIR